MAMSYDPIGCCCIPHVGEEDPPESHILGSRGGLQEQGRLGELVHRAIRGSFAGSARRATVTDRRIGPGCNRLEGLSAGSHAAKARAVGAEDR